MYARCPNVLRRLYACWCTMFLWRQGSSSGQNCVRGVAIVGCVHPHEETSSHSKLISDFLVSFWLAGPPTWYSRPSKGHCCTDSLILYISIQMHASYCCTKLLLAGFPFFLHSLTCCLPPAPLKLRPYGAIQICLLLLMRGPAIVIVCVVPLSHANISEAKQDTTYGKLGY